MHCSQKLNSCDIAGTWHYTSRPFSLPELCRYGAFKSKPYGKELNRLLLLVERVQADYTKEPRAGIWRGGCILNTAGSPKLWSERCHSHSYCLKVSWHIFQRQLPSIIIIIGYGRLHYFAFSHSLFLLDALSLLPNGNPLHKSEPYTP